MNDLQLPSSWENLLSNTIQQPYFTALNEFIKEAYTKHICFPPYNQLFAALNACSFANIKVVILGQDPYHGPGQAHGLAFSVNEGILFPPSLKNILKELSTDINVEIPFAGNLSKWAQQGVLLLNTVLTVEKGKPGSHQGKGWEQFTDAIIQLLSQQKEHLVFLLWGSHAQKKTGLIDKTKHCILTAGHPSPMSANRGLWFGNQHFSRTNAYLKEHNKAPIDWEL